MKHYFTQYVFLAVVGIVTLLINPAFTHANVNDITGEIARLREQIQALQTQLQALQAQQTNISNPVISENAPSVRLFQAGDAIQTSAPLNVRSAPAITALKVYTVPNGTSGQIEASESVLANGYRWWRIAYAGGIAGWSAENWLLKGEKIKSSVIVLSLSPVSGPVGTSVEVTGSGFSPTANALHFGARGAVRGVSSANGTSLSFTVPLYVTGDPPQCPTDAFCAPPAPVQITPDTYLISVTTSAGATSNSKTFTVTDGTSLAAPVISSLSPVSGPVGTKVTITGSGFTAANNRVKFGDGYLNGLNSNGTEITFVVPAELATCSLDGTACTDVFLPITSGLYAVSVVNGNGTSNTLSFTVNATAPPHTSPY